MESLGSQQTRPPSHVIKSQKKPSTSSWQPDSLGLLSIPPLLTKEVFGSDHYRTPHEPRRSPTHIPARELFSTAPSSASPIPPSVSITREPPSKLPFSNDSELPLSNGMPSLSLPPLRVIPSRGLQDCIAGETAPSEPPLSNSVSPHSSLPSGAPPSVSKPPLLSGAPQLVSNAGKPPPSLLSDAPPSVSKPPLLTGAPQLVSNAPPSLLGGAISSFSTASKTLPLFSDTASFNSGPELG